MMPLTMAQPGTRNLIKKVGGKPETRQFLENLGFVTGGMVSVISRTGGNVIVEVKGTRVAVNRDMAAKIMI
ncbi:MAG: ferrous iron transport protein A [Oscillospiraceae bacterium]|nr:ferrous iron transport protein A [Oscillospiraceae bacterium]MDE6932445.1 ferrous iron transport protein A [Oscillospiraceae bacterium]MDE7041877.1 ferrous iron transport protein A [Oscillospiraceae bacterium]